MSPLLVIIVAVAASVLLVVLCLGTVFGVGSWLLGRARRRIEPGDVVLDSGRRLVRVVLKEYRRERHYSAGRVRVNEGCLVLTRDEFVLLFAFGVERRLPRAEASRFDVRHEGGRLYLHTARPPGATGDVTISLRVDDPAAWVARLLERGATASPTPR